MFILHLIQLVLSSHNMGVLYCQSRSTVKCYIDIHYNLKGGLKIFLGLLKKTGVFTPAAWQNN